MPESGQIVLVLHTRLYVSYFVPWAKTNVRICSTKATVTHPEYKSVGNTPLLIVLLTQCSLQDLLLITGALVKAVA